MSRRRIAEGTLAVLFIAGLIVIALQIAEHLAESAAEERAISASKRWGGRVAYVGVARDLPNWINKSLPHSYPLRYLDLGKTQVTDEGLKEFAELINWQTILLKGTIVTDAGLKELAGQRSLQKLDLSYTKVTDAGIEELAGLLSLLSLDLTNTRVTELGVMKLRKALPECHIVH